MKTISANKQFLTDLFSGEFRGHAVIMNTPWIDDGGLGDFTVSTRPVSDWVPVAIKRYEMAVKYQQEVQDDSVPYDRIVQTNTGIFASAFGCKIHVYDMATNAAAMPMLDDVADADALPEPELDGPVFSRIFELARLMRSELGPDVPICVPDMQSPLDVAALIWNKQYFFEAMLDYPESVHNLIGKCRRFIEKFVDTYIAEIGNVNLCHCPTFWAPPALGISMSEDEIGALSRDMFNEFCLPTLTEMSNKYGGIFLHCCANADHQYEGLQKLPNFRGLNRELGASDRRLTVNTFAGKTVLNVAWQPIEAVEALMDMAKPNSRFLFNMDSTDIDDAKRTYERVKSRM
ncbi:MAG: uroporphyrinogen decarboxylase family protein [bacterium]